ncbi:MBOAT family O-acyltransferase [Gelidibacter maritimus]|uniref:MBOAT family protein n=1 Tax=Gelidibacter maritimus TaxID=2761487 RepID=A0A7W2M6V8_9FLAO|nr:MBOAT family protein [Gelidibacter maritimus]MBA6153591.1 MBOAT family protein [Gelidibacter maritimus]
MLFNSIDFAIFLPIVFCIYWFITQKNLKAQNLFILFASYVFYGWWDWRFLSLIIFSTIVDYSIGITLGREENPIKRKMFLWISIFTNLGFLGFFKYFNFFLENLQSAYTFFGSELNISSLHIILPVGISFYTFQTLSYTIDIYKGKLEPTKDIIAFSAFVSFFPQLVAGPIERATSLLPQFFQKRQFDYNQAVNGMRQILWGFFKKIVIADNCAMFANQFFNNSSEFSGSSLFLGAVFFTFQIYCDFSGYSDIAIGTSRLFGFDLKQNFAFPYFSRDIAEFWRRWHISLSTWFRDYLYIPLGGSRGGKWMKIRNTFIIFIVSGFWHGANWTFIVWGALNAIYFLPLLITKRNRTHLGTVAENSVLPSFKEFINMAFTFLLSVIAWVFFRAKNVEHAISYLKTIFSNSLFSIPEFENKRYALEIIVLVIFMLIIEWLGRRDQYGIEKLALRCNRKVRLSIYLVLVCLIYLYLGKEQEFIYFQF